MLPTFTSMAAIQAITGPWAAVRTYDGDGNTIPNGGTRVHRARDIYLPPGTPIYLPFDGTVAKWSTSNSGGDETMGLVCAVVDDQGRTWRFIHLAVATARRATLPAGTRVRAGTQIGTTSAREYLGQHSKSHLHLDLAPRGVTDKDKFIDPLPVLGVDGFNRMIGGGVSFGGITLVILAAAGAWWWYSSKRSLRL